MSSPIGQPLVRVDGTAKVTGAAGYAGDTVLPGMLHGLMVQSTIARGTITGLDVSAARSAPGVVAVYTHENTPRLHVAPFPYLKGYVPMQDTRVHHTGQTIAYVVARGLEQAREAATLVTARYDAEPVKAVIADALDEVYLPPPGREGPQEVVIGDPEAALGRAEVKIDREYSSPTHHHHPIEPSATVAHWEGDQLTLHESAQGISFTQQVVATALGIDPAKIRVLAPYIGGGFGAKGPVWPHTLLTAAIAREVRAPLKLVLTRAQMFTSAGHRAEFRQRVVLGAGRDGKLSALVNISTQQLSRTDEAVHNASESTRMLYGCPNIRVRQQGVRLDIASASLMRSPETTSHHGIETALDELSHELGIDPVELRLRNHTDVNPETGQRYSGKHLRECYHIAANAFGWSRRDPKPGNRRVDGEFVGWGMATEAHTFSGIPSSAWVRISPDGSVLGRSGTHDIGTGTYTVLTQVTSAALGIPTASIRYELGDTAFPRSSLSAASATINSVSGAVDKAARAARAAVVEIAVNDPRSPLHGIPADRITTEHGYLFGPRRWRRESYRDVLTRHGEPVEATGSVANVGGYTTGAVFLEVRVNPRFGRVRVTRVVTAHDPGRVMNRRTASSQVIGGVTWGVGFALMEHTVYDRRTARVVNPSLSSYLVPVNLDIPVIEPHFVDRPDPVSQALGARGFGETPGTGVPSAISNAVFNATGRRVRDLPITQDKLL